MPGPVRREGRSPNYLFHGRATHYTRSVGAKPRLTQVITTRLPLSRRITSPVCSLRAPVWRGAKSSDGHPA